MNFGSWTGIHGLRNYLIFSILQWSSPEVVPILSFELMFRLFVWSICTLDKYTLGQVLLNWKFLFFYSEFLIWKCFFNKRSKIKLQIQKCLHRNSYFNGRTFLTDSLKLIFIYIYHFHELENFKADFSAGQKIFSQAIKMFNLGRLRF